MPTIQKFYLHDATTADTGTMPSTFQGGDSISAGTDATASTPRAMDGTAGSAQAATPTDTLANNTNFYWFRQFVSTPLTAQTLGAGSWSLATAGSGTKAPAHNCVIFVWRPSTGTNIGTIFDNSAADFPLSGTAWPTTEAGSVAATFTGTGVTCLASDILCVQIIAIATGSLGGQAAFNYDGTTDPTDGTATSNAASYVNAPATITLQDLAPGVVATVNFAYGPN